MMPVDLVLVRHGQSEGNVAQHAAVHGDTRHWTKEFRNRHSSTYRLSDLGIEQAKQAGKWIRGEKDGGHFDRAYVSPYIRALETAGYLGLPGVSWYQNLDLRERDGGDFESLHDEERRRLFQESMDRRAAEPLFWTPPNGESIADTCGRLVRVLDTLHRECAEKRVVMVLHGETMWACRVLLERWSSRRFAELHTSKLPQHRIHNCQVIHYTRRHPQTEELAKHYTHVRSVNPMNPSSSEFVWTPIERETFTNDDLLAYVERTPRLITD